MPNNNETTTKFKVDISELKSAMQEAKRQVQVANSEFKAISSSMEDWRKNSDGLSAKLKQLDNNLKSQKTVLSSLEKQYELTVAQMGEGSAQADRLKIAINNQKAVVNGTQREINKYETELSNLATDTDDAGESTEDLTEELDKLNAQTKDTGDGFTVFKGVLANLATQGINLVIDGAKKAGEALVGMVKDSVNAYAEYEQLIGGVETLFKDSADTVQNYANNAYKTAGMSANEYMETVTSFSASLLSALNGDTAESAKIADMAITDMSDNANKMGTDMASIQNAYQGFAKQNYTMLDNLKLGYGGTKEEMQRLLDDASKLSGQEYDISNLNDVFQAIHVVQEEMGITGTTAKEASTTIEGSTASMKSAWQNLVAGMANEKVDFGALVDNLVDSVSTMLSNVMPRVIQSISGIGQLISALAPIIAEQLPVLIDQVLPTLLSALSTLLEAVLSAIITSLPSILSTLLDVLLQIIDTILGMLPQLTSTMAKIITQLLLALSKAVPDILVAIVEIVPQIIEALLNELPTFLQACITFLMAIVEALPTIITALVNALPSLITTFINTLVNNYDVVLKGAIQLFMGIVKAIPQIIVALVKALPDIIKAIVDGLKSGVSKIKDVGKNLIEGLWNGIKDMTSWIKDKIKGFGESVVSGLKDFFGIHSPSKLMADEIGKFLPEGIAVGIDKNAKSVMNAMRDLTMNTLGATRNGLIEAGVTGGATGGVVNNFYQTNNSPKALSRLEIYRQSKNLLGFAGGGM